VCYVLTLAHYPWLDHHNNFFSLALQPPWALASSFSFMIILQTVRLLRRVISPSQGLYLNTGQHKHRVNIYTHQTSIPWVGLEPTIPASQRTKTVHALDRSATVTGDHHNNTSISFYQLNIILSASHKAVWSGQLRICGAHCNVRRIYNRVNNIAPTG
jgi:hypothetical protein